MANMTKKQLADALTKALFGNKFVSNDDENGYESLGYVHLSKHGEDGNEPLVIIVGDNGVEFHWMYEAPVGTDSMSDFLIGVVYMIDPSLKVEDSDTRDLVFGYTEA